MMIAVNTLLIQALPSMATRQEWWNLKGDYILAVVTDIQVPCKMANLHMQSRLKAKQVSCQLVWQPVVSS